MADDEDNKTEIEESLDGLFVDPNSRPQIHAQQVFLTMSVTKPKKGVWFRVHRDHEREVFAVADPSDNDKLYVVFPAVAVGVPPELLMNYQLVGATTRQETPFVWPLRLAGEDGRTYDAWETAREAAKLAKISWLTMSWSKEAGRYLTKKAIGDFGEPQWPDPDEYPFNRWVELAFKGRIIRDEEHVLLKTLRGEA